MVVGVDSAIFVADGVDKQVQAWGKFSICCLVIANLVVMDKTCAFKSLRPLDCKISFLCNNSNNSNNNNKES